MNRRAFLKQGLASSALALAAISGALIPNKVLANWPKSAFNAKTVPAAVNELFTTTITNTSNRIIIHAPKRSEEGGEVPITISSTLKQVRSITILVENNPTPLVAHFQLSEKMIPVISTSIKLKRSSYVTVILKTDKQLYSNKKKISLATRTCV